MKLKKSQIIVTLVLTSVFIITDNALASSVVPTKTRTIQVDLSKVIKNLSHSYLGADCEAFATSLDTKWLLNQGEEQFTKFCQATGIRVFRLAYMGRYSIYGADATAKLAIMRRAAHRAQSQAKKESKNNPKSFTSKFTEQRNFLYKKWSNPTSQKYQNAKLNFYDPSKLYDFCRNNHIKVIASFNGRDYYDTKAKEARYVANRPKQYKAAAQAAAQQLKWVKAHGYLNLVVGWEIGNEAYQRWEPEQYAAYVKEVITLVRKIDPKIKLAITVFAARPELRNKSNFQRKNTRWSRKMLQVLGSDAKYITYGVVHLYGGNWNANYKALKYYSKFLKAVPNARHLKMICTEWNDQSSGNYVTQRRFDIGGLWRVKFALMLISYKGMQYNTVHSILYKSGLGYYSNGQVWTLQRSREYPHDRSKKHIIPDSDHKKQIALGPFAVGMRMCNALINSYPLMVQYHNDLGPDSSELYYSSIYPKVKNKPNGGLQWLVSTNKKRSSLCAVVVNTTLKAQSICFIPKGNKRLGGKANIEVYTCDQNKWHWVATPSATGYLHDKQVIQSSAEPVTLPPFSVVKIVMPLAKSKWTKDVIVR